MSHESEGLVENAKFAISVLDSELSKISIPLSKKVGHCAVTGDVKSAESVSIRIKQAAVLRLRDLIKAVKQNDSFWRDIVKMLDRPDIAEVGVESADDDSVVEHESPKDAT